MKIHDGYVSQAEREEGQKCAAELRQAKTALMLAAAAAQNAGFGAQLLNDLHGLVYDLNHIQKNYELE